MAVDSYRDKHSKISEHGLDSKGKNYIILLEMGK